MPYTVSALPTFQNALITQLQARTALASVSIVPGPPSPGVGQRLQWICLLEAKGTQKWSAMGRLQKEERMKQRVYVSVLTRDGEGDSARGRDTAYSYLDEVAQQLIDDPTVSATVWEAQIGEDIEFYPRLGISVPDATQGTTVDLSWREACLYFDITYKIRLHP